MHRGQEFVARIVERRGVGQRADLRLRAAHAVRRRAATPARAGASRAPRRSTSTPTEDGVRQPRSRAGCEVPSAVALVPARAGSTRVPGQERRAAGGPPADRLHDRGGARERRCSTRSSSRPTRRRSPRSPAATAPRCRACGRRRSRAPPRPTSSGSRHVLDGTDWERLLAPAPDEPVPHGGDDPPRVGRASWRVPDGRLAACGAARARAPGQDVAWSSGELMAPLLAAGAGRGADPLAPDAALPPVYVQDSSLEIAWTRIVGRRRDRRPARVAVLHARASRGSRSTTPTTSRRPRRSPPPTVAAARVR